MCFDPSFHNNMRAKGSGKSGQLDLLSVRSRVAKDDALRTKQANKCPLLSCMHVHTHASLTHCPPQHYYQPAGTALASLELVSCLTPHAIHDPPATHPIYTKSTSKHLIIRPKHAHPLPPLLPPHRHSRMASAVRQLVSRQQRLLARAPVAVTSRAMGSW